jgi:hypothetical protein
VETGQILTRRQGAIGGRAHGARYLVGTCDSSGVLCLDPHVVQPRVSMSALFDVSTYHCALANTTSVRMTLASVDPSIARARTNWGWGGVLRVLMCVAVAFYCADSTEREDFYMLIRQIANHKSDGGDDEEDAMQSCVIAFADTSPKYVESRASAECVDVDGDEFAVL